jgi:hypothetical protein
MKVTYRPEARESPRLRASASPAADALRSTVRPGSSSRKSSMICGVMSTEPSSMTMNSKSGLALRFSEVSASAMYGSPSRTGTTTDSVITGGPQRASLRELSWVFRR